MKGVGSLDDGAALQKLLDEGWAYHDSESERLAREIEAVAGDGAPSQLEPFIHLANHTAQFAAARAKTVVRLR
jgi:hypothetical protein